MAKILQTSTFVVWLANLNKHTVTDNFIINKYIATLIKYPILMEKLLNKFTGISKSG